MLYPWYDAVMLSRCCGTCICRCSSRLVAVPYFVALAPQEGNAGRTTDRKWSRWHEVATHTYKEASSQVGSKVPTLPPAREETWVIALIFRAVKTREC